MGTVISLRRAITTPLCDVLGDLETHIAQVVSLYVSDEDTAVFAPHVFGPDWAATTSHLDDSEIYPGATFDRQLAAKLLERAVPWIRVADPDGELDGYLGTLLFLEAELWRAADRLSA